MGGEVLSTSESEQQDHRTFTLTVSTSNSINSTKGSCIETPPLLQPGLSSRKRKLLAIPVLAISSTSSQETAVTAERSGVLQSPVLHEIKGGDEDALTNGDKRTINRLAGTDSLSTSPSATSTDIPKDIDETIGIENSSEKLYNRDYSIEVIKEVKKPLNGLFPHTKQRQQENSKVDIGYSNSHENTTAVQTEKELLTTPLTPIDDIPRKESSDQKIFATSSTIHAQDVGRRSSSCHQSHNGSSLREHSQESKEHQTQSLQEHSPHAQPHKQTQQEQPTASQEQLIAKQEHLKLQHQPEGWRVKLYRLKADGTWGDCGTGRIVCLYRSSHSHKLSNDIDNTSSSRKKCKESRNESNDDSLDKNDKSIDQWLYHETGEATLCVHAEASERESEESVSDTNSIVQSSTSNQKDTNNHKKISSPSKSQESGTQVLLQTRILLREPYQRQGDSIITWCEPFFQTTKQHRHDNSGVNSKTNNITGSSVDWALSFQDNAGCLAIWKQITYVQGRVASLLRQHNQQRQQHSQPQQQRPLSTSSSTGSATSSLSSPPTESVEDVISQAAAQHHARLQQEQQDSKKIPPQANQQHDQHYNTVRHISLHNDFLDDLLASNQNSTMNNHEDSGGIGDECDMDSIMDNFGSNDYLQQSHQTSPSTGSQLQQLQWQLPNNPTLQNLDDISNVFASVQHVVQHRESLVPWLIADDCLYVRQLLSLFPSAEAREDSGKLATLAACIKFVLLLNDPSLLGWVVNDGHIFELVCSCLEYDPDLRERAHHRSFLRECAKFRTVVRMDDPSLITLIHRAFRVAFIRDTLLRPTMDESSLSTLNSLQTFTHNDVIKGVAMSSGSSNDSNTQHHTNITDNSNDDHNELHSNSDVDVTETLKNSYLARVIRMLGVEVHSLTIIDWTTLEESAAQGKKHAKAGQLCTPGPGEANDEFSGEFTSSLTNDPSIAIQNPDEPHDSTTWKQYLAPQDGSVASRKFRRRGCLCFLRELFTMARMSLQPRDKDDFFSAICRMEIDLLQTMREQSVGNEDIDDDDDDDVGGVGGGGSCSAVDDFYPEGSDTISQTSQTVEVGSVASTVRSSDYRLDIGETKVSSSLEHMIGSTANNSTGNGTGFDNAYTASSAQTTSTVTGNASVTSFPSSTCLLSILGNVLADPTIDAIEMNAALEIVSSIAMHDPSLIRRHSLDVHRIWKKKKKAKRKSLSSNSSLYNRVETVSIEVTGRPDPNEKKQVIFFCLPDDLLSSLLYLLGVEVDARVLFQVSEIMRIILDTEMVSGNDHGSGGPLSPTSNSSIGPIAAGMFFDENNNNVDDEYTSEHHINSLHDHHHHHIGNQGSHGNHTTCAATTEQKQFLSMFYEQYVEWLVVPFQCKLLLRPSRRIPAHILRDPSESLMLSQYLITFQKCSSNVNLNTSTTGISSSNDVEDTNSFWKLVSPCAVRGSFAIEVLSFCVRAHLHRMKFFLLKSRVLGSVLNLLRKSPQPRFNSSNDVSAVGRERCLKLAALRLLRSVLSVDDDSYHRHIIQHDLFGPVFDAFRSNGARDNLILSSIMELCDFIHTKAIKSLLNYIVTKHLKTNSERDNNNDDVAPSLEALSSPYVSTLMTLRITYESNLAAEQTTQHKDSARHTNMSGIARFNNKARVDGDGALDKRSGNDITSNDINMLGLRRNQQQLQGNRQLSGRALEDQRRFRAVDEEESYFDIDDEDDDGELDSTVTLL